jgi:hypothetical protein
MEVELGPHHGRKLPRGELGAAERQEKSKGKGQKAKGKKEKP